MRIIFRHLLGSTVTVLLCALIALGQNGSIAGTVTDTNGAVIQDAEVSVRNLQSNATRSTHTSDTGAYSIVELPIGTYEVAVTKGSFKTFRVPDVQVTVAQTVSLNPRLEPGAVSETVEVRADEMPNIDLETSQVSNLVDQTRIKELPLITRNPYELVLLSPGTSQTNTSLGGYTVNGSRERNNNFLLDGVDNNDTSVPGIAGGVLSANPESTQEFRVITNNFNAEFGRNTGAIIDVVTKSGGNTFHGDAYWFGRYNGFGGARDWFNRAPNQQDPYVRNQFGFSVSGPIIKDRTFFFFNEEFNRFVTTLTGVATVPTAAFKTGVFNYTYIDPNTLGTTTVPVDLTPSSSQNIYGLPLDPTAQQILALYPNPDTSADGLSGTIHYPSSSRTSVYNPVVKLDHRFTSKHSFNGRYGYNHFFDPNPFHDEILPGNIAATSEKAISQAAYGNLVSNFTNNVLNSFAFGWNRIYANFRCGNRDVIDNVSPLDAFGNGRDYYMDPFTSFGCLSLVSNGQFRKTGTTSYTDTVSWVRGAHNMKFGFDFRNIHEGGPNGFFSRRQVNTNTFQVFGDPVDIGFNLIDVPGVTDVAGLGVPLSDAASALYGFVAEDFNAEYFNKAGVRQGTDDKAFRQHEYDWFVQDAWKVRPNFTLTLGLRYQLDGVPYEENANFSNLLSDPATTFPVVMSIVGPGTGNRLYEPDYSNIEPRVGFSWDPRSDGKTAVRGAFGIFHDRVFGNLFGNARGNPPFEQDYLQFPFETINDAFGSGLFPAIVPDTVPSATIADGAELAPIIFDTHFRNSASNNWNFGIQQQISANNTLDLSYVGSKGTHIYRQVDGNPPDPSLVQQLVQICSDPNDPANTTGCVASQVSGLNLYQGGDTGTLPFNAVLHNALLQPFYQRSVGNSSYNALQLKATHRMSHGLQVQGAYTWAHAIDDSSDPLAPAQGNRTFPRNSRNLAQDRSNSDNDVRHVGVINYIWELPIGKGKGFLSDGVLGRIFEGIEFSGITTLQTGHPFTVRGRRDSQRTGIAAWADQVSDPFAPGLNDDPSVNGGNKVFFRDPDAFANPPFGRQGNTNRNQFYGPGFINFDMAFAKSMSFTERFKGQLRFEGFNIFNHPHFTNPTDNLIGNLGSFGLINSTVGRPDGTTSARQIQVALKLSF